MKKLSEFKGEAAIRLWGELINPITEILSNPEIKALRKKRAAKIEYVEVVLKNHPQATIKILATLNGVPVEKYKCDFFSLPSEVLSLLDDEDFMRFFNSQGQNTESPSASASTITEAKKK